MRKFILVFLLIPMIGAGQVDSTRIRINKQRSTMFALIAGITVPCSIVFEKNKIVPYSIITICTGLSIGYSNHKKKYLRNSLFAIAGVLDAFNRELSYHYTLVKDKMPYLDDHFFGPDSWKNKYNANYPFATNLLVGTTDGDHASRSLNKLCVVGGMITLDYKKKSLKCHLKQILMSSFYYSLSKGITHYYFTKKY